MVKVVRKVGAFAWWVSSLEAATTASLDAGLASPVAALESISLLPLLEIHCYAVFTRDTRYVRP